MKIMRDSALISYACLLLCSAAAHGATGGPDSFGHYWYDSYTPAPQEPYSWIEIAPPQGGSGTELMNLTGQDDACESASIGFSFDFYGNAYTDVVVSTNGFVTFASAGCSSPTNVCIPDPTQPNDAIYAFWNDLNLGNNYPEAKVYYETQGSAPSRQFVVEWYRVPHISDSASRFTFEIILFEGVGQDDVKVQYNTMSNGTGSFADGRSATLGIENSDGSDALQYWCGAITPTPTAGPVSDGLAIRYTVQVATPNALRALADVPPRCTAHGTKPVGRLTERSSPLELSNGRFRGFFPCHWL